MARVAGVMRRVNAFAVLFPVLCGVPFLCIGLSELYETAQMVGSCVATTGTVVDNVWRAFAEGGASYVPVVEFRDRSGEVVRFTDGVGTFPPEYEVGSEVDVLYDPENVRDARIHTWKRIWFAPTLITSIGVLPLLVGVAAAWLTWRKDAAS